jgi:hypothetical protein
MNPSKCGFEVSTGEFLGFMAYERGLKLNKRV